MTNRAIQPYAIPGLPIATPAWLDPLPTGESSVAGSGAYKTSGDDGSERPRD